MKALSIRYPWVELILQGRKTLEIRRWSTVFRGRIALHAAFNLDRDAMRQFPDIERPEHASALVGTVSIEDVIVLDKDRWRELRRSHQVDRPYDPEFARFAFVLSDARRLPSPIPCLGRSYLFDVGEYL